MSIKTTKTYCFQFTGPKIFLLFHLRAILILQPSVIISSTRALITSPFNKPSYQTLLCYQADRNQEQEVVTVLDILERKKHVHQRMRGKSHQIHGPGSLVKYPEHVYML